MLESPTYVGPCPPAANTLIIEGPASVTARPATKTDAGWSSQVAREAHNLEVAGSNPVPAIFKSSAETSRTVTCHRSAVRPNDCLKIGNLPILEAAKGCTKPNVCLRERAPRNRLHKATRQVVVTIDGSNIDLSKHCTAASRVAYQCNIAETVRRLPIPRHAAPVTEVFLAYPEFPVGDYRKNGEPTDEVPMIRSAVKIVRQLYPS